MSHGYAAKSDANQAAIVRALHAVGAKVLSLHRIGNGCPDLLVQFGDPPRHWLMEVKNPKGRGLRLTEAQKKFHSVWRVEIVTSVEDALEVIGLGVPR